jgi:hypothetical protein
VTLFECTEFPPSTEKFDEVPRKWTRFVFLAKSQNLKVNVENKKNSKKNHRVFFDPILLSFKTTKYRYNQIRFDHEAILGDCILCLNIHESMANHDAWTQTTNYGWTVCMKFDNSHLVSAVLHKT